MDEQRQRREVETVMRDVRATIERRVQESSLERLRRRRSTQAWLTLFWLSVMAISAIATLGLLDLAVRGWR